MEPPNDLLHLWKIVLHDAEFAELREEFWRLVGCSDPDRTLQRFLRARKGDIQAAKTMLKHCLEWRREFGVAECMKQGEAHLNTHHLSAGKVYFHKYCKQGNLIVLVHVKLHVADAKTLDELKQVCVYQMELGRQLVNPAAERVTLIFDLTGFTMANMDFQFTYFLVHCFEARYPETLGLCLVLNAPWIFWGCWTVISQVLDPVVKNKIQFVNNKQLLDHIDADSLPVALGGTDPYSFNYIPPQDDKKSNEEVIAAYEKALALLQRSYDENTDWLLNNTNTEDKERAAKLGNRVTLSEELRGAALDYYNSLPDSLYHRLGVISNNGRNITW